jgi:hypothetical protein
MKLRHLTAASAAALLVTAPIAANAAPIERSGAPVAGESADLTGGSDFMKGLIIVLIAAAGMAFLLLTDDEPVSP